MAWDGQDGEEGGGTGSRGVPATCDPSAAALVPPHVDVRLARRVVKWMLRNYARLYGGLDMPRSEALLVNGFARRWAKTGVTTDAARAAVTYLRSTGCFAESCGGDAGQVLVLTPIKIALDIELAVLEQDRRYRERAPHVPNLLYHLLRDHGVPPADRRRAAEYVADNVVAPYLESLGLRRAAPPAPVPKPAPLPRPRRAPAAAPSPARAPAGHAPSPAPARHPSEPQAGTTANPALARRQAMFREALVAAERVDRAGAAPTPVTPPPSLPISLPPESSARLSAAGEAAMARWLAKAATEAAIEDA